MAEVKITSTGDFLEIDFRDCQLYRKGRDNGSVMKKDIIDCWLLDDAQGVELGVSSGSIQLLWDHVDEIDGFTAITSDVILLDKLLTAAGFSDELISRAFTANTLIKTGAGYCEHAYLSRTGSVGGNADLKVYDGTDNTGILIKHIDVGSDDYKGGAVKSTFSDGLYIEMSGTGTITSDLSYK